MTDPTPDARLAALVQKWRAEADTYPAATDYRAEPAAAAVRLCANELEALLAAPAAPDRALVEAVREHVNSMNDVVALGRFSIAVDPVRLVTAWRDGLQAALPAPVAGEGETCPACRNSPIAGTVFVKQTVDDGMGTETECGLCHGTGLVNAEGDSNG